MAQLKVVDPCPLKHCQGVLDRALDALICTHCNYDEPFIPDPPCQCVDHCIC